MPVLEEVPSSRLRGSTSDYTSEVQPLKLNNYFFLEQNYSSIILKRGFFLAQMMLLRKIFLDFPSCSNLVLIYFNAAYAKLVHSLHFKIQFWSRVNSLKFEGILNISSVHIDLPCIRDQVVSFF